jgi:hypothetical protein
MPTQPPFLTVRQVLDALGGVIPRSTLYRHLQTGVVPCLRLGGRCYVPASWVHEALEVGGWWAAA